VHLAPAEDGGVLVFQDPDSSGTRVRRIAEDGQVTLVRHYSIENEARNLIWDAGRELVYLVKDNELVQVDKDGKVTALIPDPANEEDDKPEQMASLQRLGDSIFIADARGNGLWVLNLETKDVFHLVGERTQHQTRLGPLPYASPERSIHDCAALDSPEVFFVNQEGEGVVAQGDALVHLDLGAFAVAPPDDRLELEGKAPAGSAPQPASAVAAGSGPAMPSHKRKVPDSGLEEHHANPPQPPGPE